jgi:inosine-uridine nucleoside N-ribohydrolase
MTKRKLILDCDPGHDDAIAILLAAGSPEIELLAITTVHGNQTLPKTTLNARRVCTVAGMTGVPIVAGMAGPLVRDPIVAADIHGESGIDGPIWPEPTVPQTPGHAVDVIIDSVKKWPGEVTLIAVGSLTNVAMAILREHEISGLIKEIVIMGGTHQESNVTPAAEFNIFADAEAARIVLRSGAPVTMVALDLSHQATADSDVVDRFRKIGGPVSDMVVALLEFFGRTYRDKFGLEAPPVHDPLAVAKVIDPTVFTTRFIHVDVETKGELTYGRTVCDFYGVTGRKPNVHFGVKLNRERFWDLVLDAVTRLEAASRNFLKKGE